MPRPVYKSEQAEAWWDVRVYADHQEVRANRVDARFMNHMSKKVMTTEMSCPRISTRKKKREEKTKKYAPLRWSLRRNTKVTRCTSITSSWKCLAGGPNRQRLVSNIVGAGKKAKGTRKKIGRRKVKNESRSPWDSSLNRPVPKPFKILACDWVQKYVLCPIRVQLFTCYFRDLLFKGIHRQTFCSPARHLFTCSCRRVSLDRKVSLKRERWNRKKTTNLGCL